MIAGLPWSSWLLLVGASGIGLAVEVWFYFRHRRDPRSAREQ